jgi:hypothetical protein
MDFDDVTQDKWYYEPIKFAYDNNLMVGLSGSAFEPELPTTRAMIATILYRLENEPEIEKQAEYSDVSDNEWYTEAINWGDANDILYGYGNDIFKPEQDITREEMAAIIARYLEYKGVEIDASSEKFADNHEIGDWAKSSVDFARALNIIKGRGGNKFAPKAQATRAETAQILMNMISEVK